MDLSKRRQATDREEGQTGRRPVMGNAATDPTETRTVETSPGCEA